jgi:apolipoprotein N-acyltransferase
LSLKGLLQYSVAFGLTIHYSRSSWLRQSHCFRLEMSFLLRNTEGFSPMLILAFLGVLCAFARGKRVSSRPFVSLTQVAKIARKKKGEGAFLSSYSQRIQCQKRLPFKQG